AIPRRAQSLHRRRQRHGDLRRRESDLDDPGRGAARRGRDDPAARMTRAGLAEKRDLLAAVLETLVPPSEDFPESGALALAHVLAIADASSPEAGVMLARAIEAIEAALAGQAGGFAALSAAQREDLLRRVERSSPEAFDALVRHTY